jgi:hypothetical protein
MSTGYNAGIDSSDVLLSYGKETVWNTLPAVQFKAVRMTGESFAETKSRTRPPEINSLGYAAHAITTQVEAGGSLNFALSSGTYDDLLAGLLNGSFTTALAINGVAGDISAVASGNKFTSTTSGKFDTVQAGQWIKVSGFGTNPVNNGYFRVTSRTTGASPEMVVVGATLINETPSGTSAQIRGSMLRNGTTVDTFYFQKKLATALFLRYGGGYVTGGSLQAQVGGYLQGNFNFLFSSEEKNTTDASTGAVQSAPTGRVIDTITGISSLSVNDTPIAAVVQGITLNITKDNARIQRGIGSAAARGMARGTVNGSGSMSVYFLDFTYYDLYKNETDIMVSYRALDDQGSGYIITLPSATLINPQVVAGGPDTDLVSEFTLEANAAASGTYAGVVLQIDKF